MKRSSVSHQIGVESTQKGRSSPEALPRGSLVHAALVDLRWALAPLLVCTTAVLLTIAGCGAAAIIPARPRFRPRNGLGCPHPADVATRDGDPLPPLNSFPGAPAACGGLRCRGHHRPCRTGRSGQSSQSTAHGATPTVRLPANTSGKWSLATAAALSEQESPAGYVFKNVFDAAATAFAAGRCRAPCCCCCCRWVGSTPTQARYSVRPKSGRGRTTRTILRDSCH